MSLMHGTSNRHKVYPNTPPPEAIAQYEAKWKTAYKGHALAHLVEFVPTEWLVSIGSRKFDMGTNDLKGKSVSGERLNQVLMQEGMVHPLIVSINGVGHDYRIRLDCGQHRARVALLIAELPWLPCYIEVSHDDSPFIRSNGQHEYPISANDLVREPDIRAQFMRPSDLLARYTVEMEPIQQLKDALDW